MTLLRLTFALVVLTSRLSDAGPGTTSNIEEVFEGRCWEYQRLVNPEIFTNSPINCTELWVLFTGAFAYKDPCVTSVEDYIPFSVAATHYMPPGKHLFWESVYPFVNDYSANGKRYTTVADTLLGFMADDLVWCGQAAEPGINYSDCPRFGDCVTGGPTDYNYWSATSVYFSEAASGVASVMMNGSFELPYDPNSIFSRYELVNLTPEKNVTRLDILVVHNLGGPVIESCGEGSIQNLTNKARDQGLEVTCVNNPESIRHFQCVDDVIAIECDELRAARSRGLTSWPSMLMVVLTTVLAAIM